MFKGEKSYTHGDMQSVQYGAVIGQVNLAHQPPTVRFFVLFFIHFEVYITHIIFASIFYHCHLPVSVFSIYFVSKCLLTKLNSVFLLHVL